MIARSGHLVPLAAETLLACERLIGRDCSILVKLLGIGPLLRLRSLMNVGRGGVETQSGISLAHPNSRVDPKHSLEMGYDLAPEISRPRIAGPELSLQALPWHERGLPQIAHAVGEPHVKVDGEGRSLQLPNRSEIYRDR